MILAIPTVGLFAHRSRRDLYAPLRPYMEKEQTTFFVPMAGRPGYGFVSRDITLLDAPPKLVRDTLDAASSGPGWVHEPGYSPGVFPYWAHQGPSKDMYVSPAISLQDVYESYTQVTYVDPHRVLIVDSHPVSWWERIWIKLRFRDNATLDATVYKP